MDPNHQFPVGNFPKISIDNPQTPQTQAENIILAPQKPPQEPTEKNNRLPIYLISIAIVTVTSVAVIGYAYYKKVGPFKIETLSESTFLTNVAEKVSQIESASYKVSAFLNVTERDADAKPFTIKISNTPELREKFQNDSERISAVAGILNLLRYQPNNTSFKDLKSMMNSDSYYSKNLKITDPVTAKEYDYKVTENGTNFNLTVNFDTKDAIRVIQKSYNYAATTTIINGNSVTFTKGSYGHYYFPSEPPKPLLVELSEYSRMLTPDISGSFSVSAASDMRDSEKGSSWKFNFDASGDFGDLSYKVNADALKKDSDYYFKINNIPSFFMSGFSGLKGKWVKISSNTSTSTDQIGGYSSLSYLAKEIPDSEKDYKKNREKFVKLLRKAIVVADEENIIEFKNVPVREKVEGEDLTKYGLRIRKDSILAFYKKMISEINNDPDLADYKLLVDQGVVDYLQSEEFSDVFDYIDKNENLTMWVDSLGYPAIIEVKLRLVPPDTATQLKDKQANVILRLSLGDINTNVSIEAPKDAERIEEVIKQEQKNLYGSNSTTLIKTNLSSVRAYAELVYDKSNSYGKKSFTLGSCSKAAGTLFADDSIYKSLNLATDDNISKATCTSDTKAYAISIPLPDSIGYSWCIDSQGVSKQISGSIKGLSCK